MRRMAPPGRRAAVWLAATAGLVLLIVLQFSSHPLIEQRMSVARMMLECVGSALTAVAAIMAAFELSVPGHSPHWRWVPLPPLLLWLGASGAGCLQNGMGLHTPYTHHMPSCFIFIVSVSLPLSVALFWMLRRARPIAPLPVALSGALGVAATAATLLQFFHPFDITWLDLGIHLGAVAVIVAVAGTLRETLLASAKQP